MSIPYNDDLRWDNHTLNIDWDYVNPSMTEQEPVINLKQLKERTANELCANFREPCARLEQFVRDLLRLVLKVPIRSIWTPIVLPKNWKQRERAKINAKLAGYSFIQLVSVPIKFCVALAIFAALAISKEEHIDRLKRVKVLLDVNQNWTTHLDGRASQLEALKEEGTNNAPNQLDYNRYRDWLYNIDPKRCRHMQTSNS